MDDNERKRGKKKETKWNQEFLAATINGDDGFIFTDFNVVPECETSRMTFFVAKASYFVHNITTPSHGKFYG